MNGVGVLKSSGPYRLILSANLDRLRVLVVGGGAVGERKVRTLLSAGARVTLISPDVTNELRKRAESGEITWKSRTAEAADFKEHRLALLALPQDAALGLADTAREQGCLVDCCFSGKYGDFALCAQFEMDGCYVGVSSGGNDPVRAAATKRNIMNMKRDSEPVLAEGARMARVLTRNSSLAMTQTNLWIEKLESIGIAATKKIVVSHGDRDRKSDLAKFGGFGAFVKALEDELMNGSGDCAVHSLKDMPARLPERCALAAVLERASVYDVIITRDGRGLDSLPEGALIGTSSLRRKAQIRAVRRDLKCVTCRGNVETRLEKLKSGEVDALILAEAGIDRLGMDLPNAKRLPFITAAGQGAIAVETLKDSWLFERAASLNHVRTWLEITAERELLKLMGLGCSCPMALRASLDDSGHMVMTAAVYSVTPKERAEDEGVMITEAGAVESEEDARRLAGMIWSRMNGLPLVKELSAL